jgi:YVTN family beta-propeller protein
LPIALAVVLGGGCFPDAEGTPPDLEKAYIYYPIGVGLTQPEGRYLLVANSNFDLLYNAGTVVPLELGLVNEVIEECRTTELGQGCPEFLVPFEDEAIDDRYRFEDFLLERHAVEIGSFAGSIVVTEGLAAVSVRADASIHFIGVTEVAPSDLSRSRVLRCAWSEEADQPGSLQLCGSDHRARRGTRAREDAAIGLPSDPFSIVSWRALDSNPDDDVDDGGEFFVVSHMVGGQISLFERREDLLGVGLSRNCSGGHDDDGDGLIDADDPGCSGSMIRLVDVNSTFPEGSSGLAVDNNNRFMVTSRLDSRLTSFWVSQQGTSEIVPSTSIAVDVAAGGQNQRGLAISPNSDRAYITSRDPESIMVLDITHDDWDNYEDRFTDIIEIGQGASIVRIYADPSFPDGYLVYAVCFDEDRIFVIDPSVNEVVRVITTRRGPYDLVFDPTHKVGYLVNFLESTISVIDVDPESPRFHTILTTLGRPKRPRSND